MKIVIDIDENVYTRLFDNGIQDNEIAVDDVCEMARALRLSAPLTPDILADLLMEERIISTRNVVNVEDIEDALTVQAVPIEVLDEIRDEIYHLHHHPKLDFIKNDDVVDMALDIVDKYKESEE